MRERILALDLPIEALLRMLFGFLSREILATPRADILRLILTEAHRFPEIAALYHREVIGSGLSTLRQVLRRAAERGEIEGHELVRFPQLLIAPALVAVVWGTLSSPTSRSMPRRCSAPISR